MGGFWIGQHVCPQAPQCTAEEDLDFDIDDGTGTDTSEEEWPVEKNWIFKVLDLLANTSTTSFTFSWKE